MYMNTDLLYYLLIALLVLVFAFLKKSSKNKMRMKMMTHGILNKVILILMISVLMYEDFYLDYWHF